MSTYRPTQRAQPFRRITEERCPDPEAGRAVGEEDYSHGNYITEVTTQKTHIQKETGYQDRRKSVSTRDEAKGEGR